MNSMDAQELKDKLNKLKEELRKKLSQGVRTDQLKSECLGKKSFLREALSDLKKLSLEEKQRVGPILHSFKNELESLFIGSQKKAQETMEDLTFPGKDISPGYFHPVLATLREVVEIFEKMGFGYREGPDVETEYYNFDALRIPPGHPSRDTQDSFFVGSVFFWS